MSGEILTFPGAAPPAAPAEIAEPKELPLIEPSIAVEIFTTDLARVFVHGPFARLVWAAPDVLCDFDAPAAAQRVVNVKLIVPTENLQAIYEALGKAIAARKAVPS